MYFSWISSPRTNWRPCTSPCRTAALLWYKCCSDSELLCRSKAERSKKRRCISQLRYPMVSDASHALHALPNLALPQKKDSTRAVVSDWCQTVRFAERLQCAWRLLYSNVIKVSHSQVNLLLRCWSNQEQTRTARGTTAKRPCTCRPGRETWKRSSSCLKRAEMQEHSLRYVVAVRGWRRKNWQTCTRAIFPYFQKPHQCFCLHSRKTNIRNLLLEMMNRTNIRSVYVVHALILHNRC